MFFAVIMSFWGEMCTIISKCSTHNLFILETCLFSSFCFSVHLSFLCSAYFLMASHQPSLVRTSCVCGHVCIMVLYIIVRQRVHEIYGI